MNKKQKVVIPSASSLQSDSDPKRSPLPVTLMGPVSPKPQVARKGRKLENSDLFSSTVHVTVRHKISRISRKQLSMIAGLLLRNVIEDGLSLEYYLLLEHILQRILGSHLPLELKVESEKEISLSILLVLQCKVGFENSEENKLPSEVIEFLEKIKYIPQMRTAQSWMKVWNWINWFSVETVPVDNIFERTGNSIPYSSYCKGYGETGPSSHKKKTKFDSETDGEPVKLEAEGETFSLLKIELILDWQRIFERKRKRRK